MTDPEQDQLQIRLRKADFLREEIRRLQGALRHLDDGKEAGTANSASYPPWVVEEVFDAVMWQGRAAVRATVAAFLEHRKQEYKDL